MLAVCLSAALALPAFAVGPFNDIPTEIRMSASATKDDGNLYTVSLSARMNMADSLAKAAILGADVSVLDRVRFVCTLTVSNDIDIDWNTVDVKESSYTVSGIGTSYTHQSVDYPIYEFESIAKNGNNIVMTYKLTSDCKADVNVDKDWGYYVITEAATDHDTDMDYVFNIENWTEVRGAIEG